MRCSSLALLALLGAGARAAPQQIHLSLLQAPDAMRVMWISGTPGGVPTVRFGSSPTSLSRVATGTNATYSLADMCDAPANDPSNWVDPGQINTVDLRNLTVGADTYYSVGTAADGFSPVRSFHVGPRTPGQVRMLIFGDSGTTGSGPQTLQLVEAEANATTVDVVVDLGDLGYAMGRAAVWDSFGRLIEGTASQVPFQVMVGNHEYDWPGMPFLPSWGTYQFDSGSGGECGVPYNTRYGMDGGAGSVNNYWWSVNYGGLVHFVALSTEHNFTTGSTQYNWLLADLAAVDRTATPWVIVAMHRPIYDTTLTMLLPEETVTRNYLEPVFEQFDVDLVLTAHVHNYQRTCRVYNGTCTDGHNSTATATESAAPALRGAATSGPKGRPVLVVGSGGKDSGARFWVDSPSWLVTRSEDYGYLRMEFSNASALHLQYVTDPNATIFDDFWITK